MIQSILIRKENKYKQFFKNVVELAILLEYKDSKSFLAVLCFMICSILYPRADLFSAAGGKEQSAQILQDKVNDICHKIPAFEKEINFGKGGSKVGKDFCSYVFRSGSTFGNVAARESSRGLRRHAGILEECVGIDQKVLQEILIPMMNVSRRCMDGTVQEDEPLNQSQIYIKFLLKKQCHY